MSNNAPVQELRSGLVKAVIWRNEAGEQPWYSVSVSRLYKTGDEWRDSKSFTPGDLSRLVEVAALAMRWIALQPDGAREAIPEAELTELSARAPVSGTAPRTAA